MANKERLEGQGDVAHNVSLLQADASPSRQLRRVGTKIGRKVLPFQRPLLRIGPLHVYRDAHGGLSMQWLPRRNRARRQGK